MSTISVPSAANLDTWSSHAWKDGLQVDNLPGLEQLNVRTRNTLYEITIVSPQSGEILIRGGHYFPVFTTAVLSGASLGGSFLKRRGIYVGFRMEILRDGRTIVTSEVQSISRNPETSSIQ